MVIIDVLTYLLVFAAGFCVHWIAKRRIDRFAENQLMSENTALSLRVTKLESDLAKCHKQASEVKALKVVVRLLSSYLKDKGFKDMPDIDKLLNEEQ